MRRKTGVAAAVIAALAAGVALAAGLAGAAQTTIGFDDLPDGTVVGSQYADRGVVFGTAGRQDRVGAGR